MTRRPLAFVQLNKPLPPPGPPSSTKPLPFIHPATAATRLRPALTQTHTTTSPILQAPAPALAPDSPIPTISIDASLLWDGHSGSEVYGRHQHAGPATRTQGQGQGQARSQKTSLLQVGSSSSSRPLVPLSAFGFSFCTQAHPKVRASTTAGRSSATTTTHASYTSASTSTITDPRAHTRATTASLISLFDFLEAEETEMRAEVQRVLRRMREVKRAVRAVKRERGLMSMKRDADMNNAGAGAGVGTTGSAGGSGRERFADSEGEVTAGTAY